MSQKPHQNGGSADYNCPHCKGTKVHGATPKARKACKTGANFPINTQHRPMVDAFQAPRR